MTEIKTPSISHPAEFSKQFLPKFAELLRDTKNVIDPMAGTGKLALIKTLGYQGKVVCNDLEPEWKKSIYAVDEWHHCDAAHLDFIHDAEFDAICTSPTYGNRLADHWNRHENSKRFSYTFNLGHDLHEQNTGKMHWSEIYRQKHEMIWNECYRILKPNGLLIVNISDHIRKKQMIPVTEFHKKTLEKLTFKLRESFSFPTKRLRYGQNAAVRAKEEYILVFVK